jgi:hypothetical protein
MITVVLQSLSLLLKVEIETQAAYEARDKNKKGSQIKARNRYYIELENEQVNE